LFNPECADKDELMSDKFIIENINHLKNWNNEIIDNHSKPQLLIHKLSTIAYLEVKHNYSKDINQIINNILKTINNDGIPEVKINIPKAFGGSGVPVDGWVLCDFPTILYSLLKMGINNDITKKSVNKLQSLIDENGYLCIGSIAKFRGPGKKMDICPYANLISAKALSEENEGIKSEAAKNSVEAILKHWEVRKEQKYYLFAMGSDFQKLKFPLIWYNILHVLEVISKYKEYHNDKRVKEMVDILLSKTDKSLKFKPESIYINLKEQDFSDKKNFSPTITLSSLRILKRLGIIS